jgi:hypothetical protein
MTEHSKAIVGYSGFDLFEECYGYNENACYIADTEATAREFMEVASFSGQYRIEPVTLSRIMDDFGYSCGEFAMEARAFARFRAVASEASIEYQTAAVDGCPDLTVVDVEGVNRHADW